MPPFAKLVRDRIPEIMTAAGASFRARVLTGSALDAALRSKLAEEAEEVAQATDRVEVLAELADVTEVRDELARFHGITLDEIHAEQARKRETRGGFAEGIWVEAP